MVEDETRPQIGCQCDQCAAPIDQFFCDQKDTERGDCKAREHKEARDQYVVHLAAAQSGKPWCEKARVNGLQRLDGIAARNRFYLRIEPEFIPVD